MDNYKLFFFFTSIWILWILLIKSSTNNLGYYPFELLSVILVIELCKLIISFLLVLFNLSHYSLKILFDTLLSIIYNWKIYIYFIIPSFIYVFDNISRFYCFAYFDPVSYPMFLHIRVIISCLLFYIFLNIILTKKQWGSIIILFFALISIQYNSSFEISSIGLLYILNIFIQGYLLSFCDVYSEMLYKQNTNISIHIKNIYLFSFTFGMSLFFILLTKPDIFSTYSPYIPFFYGWNIYTWIIVILGILHGILQSFILQEYNVIIKEYSRCIMLISICILSCIIFSFNITINIMISVSLLIFSVYLNNPFNIITKKNNNTNNISLYTTL